MTSSFAQTLAAAKAGDGWAFDALFNTWNSRITGFVRGRGVNDSDDVVNEIFLGVFRSISSFKGDEAAFRAWIFRIARNKIADDYRAASRRPPQAALSHHPPTWGGDVETDADHRMGNERLHTLLGQLTDDQREVLALRIIGDLTIDQIAEMTGKRRGSVKQLQRRGLRRLERLLADEADGDSLAPPYPSSGAGR